MPKRSSKKAQTPDPNVLAFSIVQGLTREQLPMPEIAQVVDEGKNPAAVALGRLGGQKGGKARAKALSARQRQQIAKKAALVRWAKKKRPASKSVKKK